MILRNLKLKNIRSYTDESVDFPEGTVLLSGDIGSGKSSVLLAVEFALFGIMRGVLSGGSLLRHGADSGSVELTFTLGERRITVRRTLKRTSTEVVQDSGHLVVDGVRQDLTPMELKSRILELLGYPATLLTKSKDLIYRYTVYTPQEEMKAILSDQREMRLDTLRRLFQVDRYRTIKDNSMVLLRYVGRQVDILKGETADLDVIGERAKQLKAEMDSVKKVKDGLAPQLEGARKDLSEKKGCLDSLEQQRAEHERLLREDARLESQLSALEERSERCKTDSEALSREQQELKKKLEALPPQEAGAVALQELKTRVDGLQKRFRETSALRGELEQQLSSVEGMLAEVKAEAADEQELSIAMKAKQADLDELRRMVTGAVELAARRTGIEESREEVRRSLTLNEHLLSDAEATAGKLSGMEQCPLCLQRVPHDHKESILTGQRFKAKEAREKIVRAMEQLAVLAERLAALEREEGSMQQARVQAAAREAELRELERKLSRLEKAKERLAALKKERSALQERLKGLTPEQELEDALEVAQAGLEAGRARERAEQERRMLAARIEERDTRLQGLARERSELAGQRASFEEKLKTLRQSIQRFKNLESEYGGCKAALEALRAKEQMLLTRLTEVSTLLGSLEQEMARLREDISRRELKKKKLSYLRRVRDWTEKEFIPLMHLVEQQVMHRLRQEFAGLFQRYFTILLEGEEIAVRLDEEFTPVVEQNGYEMPTEDLSGGERTSLALAYRLAVTSVVNSAVTGIETRDLIILDEPTDGFSSEQLDKLRMVLDELSVRQVIIVSHESKIESFVEHVIAVNKHEHVSTVTAQ